MLYFIYKTTCLLNNRYYVGKHCTKKLDKYLGSGDVIKASIKKHGKENHVREILEYCRSKKHLAKREKEIITPEMLKDPLCMNLKPGGDGGWPEIIFTQQRRKETSARSKRMWENPLIRSKIMAAKLEASKSPAVKRKISKSSKRSWKDPAYRKKMHDILSEIQLSPQYKMKMAEAITRLWQFPEYRAKQSKARIKSWENAKQRKEKFAEVINTPEVRKKRGKTVSLRAQTKKEERVKLQKELILSSKIDFQQDGWAEKVRSVIGSSKVNGWMKANLPDILRHAYFRMPHLVKFT